MSGLFIARRDKIPHDGTRLLIAGGRVERQEDTGTVPGDGELMELAAALDEAPGVDAVRDTGREAWRQQREGGGAS